MNEYVIMPKVHWQNVCDAVREGNGTTDLILSGDAAAQIRTIGSGGISSGIVYNKMASDFLIESATVLGDTIPAYAFCNHYLLYDVAMPDVTRIANMAFYGCSAFQLDKLPSMLTVISTQAFEGCTSLAITEIPASVKEIWNRVFYGCSRLTTITFKGTPTTIHENAFENCTNLKVINVPWAEGAVANAPWGATNATINYNYGQSSNLISFSIGSTTYQAEEGMTWGQWGSSKYNIDAVELMVSNGYIYDDTSYTLALVDTGDSQVRYTDKIKSDGAYRWAMP